ncbi:MAG TPA: type II CAAX endopeptidase family protein [Synergistaceae bacterium]|nr:type II CAAX endopeptidase family protein [Synergistaceae bacterium]
MGKGQFAVLERALSEGHLSRSSCYRMLIFWEWLYTGIALSLLVSFGEFGEGELRKIFFSFPEKGCSLIFAALFLGGVLTLALVKSSEVRAFFRSTTQKVRILFPSSFREACLFAVLCCTAGICEEILYRLFVFHYFFSLGLSPVSAHLSGALAFGFAHTYQGWPGVAEALGLGIFFSLLFAATDSLLPCMLIHAWIDLLVLLYRDGKDPFFVSFPGICYNKRNKP